MKHKEVVCPIDVYSYDELPPEAAKLVELAREATFRSYAPYSKFSVGAAISLDNGEIVCGANQENAAFPSSTCAERSACYYAHATYPQAKFVAIAIAARGTDGEFVADPISPCGACRQALLEYETLAGRGVEVWLAGRDAVYRVPAVRSLLPLAFSEF